MDKYNRWSKKDGEVETLAMDPDNSYREEAPVSMASRSADDENDSNPPGRSSSESAFLKTRGRCIQIGIWNVRTLYQPGKFENLIQEMQNMNLDILGITETHWTEEGKIIQDSDRLFERDRAQEWKALASVLVLTLGTNWLIPFFDLSDGATMEWR